MSNAVSIGISGTHMKMNSSVLPGCCGSPCQPLRSSNGTPLTGMIPHQITGRLAKSGFSPSARSSQGSMLQAVKITCPS